jgi:hypothetical protein
MGTYAPVIPYEAGKPDSEGIALITDNLCMAVVPDRIRVNENILGDRGGYRRLIVPCFESREPTFRVAVCESSRRPLRLLRGEGSPAARTRGETLVSSASRAAQTPSGICGPGRTSFGAVALGGLFARRPLLRHRLGPGAWDSSGSVGLLCRRRPERELAQAVQSRGVAGSVAAVTEQGQALLVAGGGGRVVPRCVTARRGRACLSARAGHVRRCCSPVRRGWCLVGSQLPGCRADPGWLSGV